MSVTVVGVSASCGLGERARDAIRAADLLVGSPANLLLADAPATAERIELGPLEPALQRIARARNAVVVASGDPGFFGIARTLRAAGHDCEVLPAVSSVAAICAHAGVGWDDVVVVSAHGRPAAPALNGCRAFPAVAVLTGPGCGPSHIAQALDGWSRDLVIGERLGLADERIRRLPATEAAIMAAESFREPNVVICLDPRHAATTRGDNQPAAAPASGWALPESAYLHRDSMITKGEVRALVVARLRPALGRLVLDLGAGSGSVAVECNRLGAAVIAVEQDAAACATVAANAEAHEAQVRVVEGSAPDVLHTLPAADAAFVGGGGIEVIRDVVRRGVPTVVAAFAALDRAVAAHELLRAGGYRVEGVQLAASRLAELPGGSLRLAATNPVIVLTGELS